MDEALTQAARALAAGDPLAALARVALREDGDALALRGIAMAQLGDYTRAAALLRRAQRALPEGADVAHARCAVALAEVSLAARSTDVSLASLASARRVLLAAGEVDNALRAGLVAVGTHLLAGEVGHAEDALARTGAQRTTPSARAARALVAFDVALRRGRAKEAKTCAERALREASRSRVPALVAEAEAALFRVSVPSVRVITGGQEARVDAVEAERVLGTRGLVVDACARALVVNGARTSLATRPVLFTLLRALAVAHPRAAPRTALIQAAFGAKHRHASLRARLRVEIGRLRTVLGAHAAVRATPDGFALEAPAKTRVTVIAPLEEGVDATLLGLLADGAAWPAASLAKALGTSARTVQRALHQLVEGGHVVVQGRGRMRRVVRRPVVLSSFEYVNGGDEDVIA